jgi:dihydroorotate dehydrogenase
MYRFLRRILFLLPAETAHHVSMNVFVFLCRIPPVRSFLASIFRAKGFGLKRNLLGLNFPNPVGLGAGFDKNARYLDCLEVLGFGFAEIGTVTPRPQAGNDKPRLFRLPEDMALINRMGFNNDGVDTVSKRLKKWRQKNRSTKLLIGGNIGKNKDTPNEEAWKDYEICFRALHPYVDFFVVNVSSPNTPGLRALQGKEALSNILTRLQELNRQFETQRPILLKIAPDLEPAQIDDVLDLAGAIDLDGLVATNTTIAREPLSTDRTIIETIGAGGLSGKPLRKNATSIVTYIQKKTSGTMMVIGSGGIFTGDDAKEKLAAGASLVEIWTGFIYEGPFIVKRICKSLESKN